jgi:hypothetical protein
MGYGEYGGNGSVHWYGSHKRDRNNGNGQAAHDYHEVDDFPASGGNFTIEVFGLKAGTSYKVDANGTLQVSVKIKHDATNYTEQVLITWPDPP